MHPQTIWLMEVHNSFTYEKFFFAQYWFSSVLEFVQKKLQRLLIAYQEELYKTGLLLISNFLCCFSNGILNEWNLQLNSIREFNSEVKIFLKAYSIGNRALWAQILLRNSIPSETRQTNHPETWMNDCRTNFEPKYLFILLRNMTSERNHANGSIYIINK